MNENIFIFEFLSFKDKYEFRKHLLFLLWSPKMFCPFGFFSFSFNFHFLNKKKNYQTGVCCSKIDSIYCNFSFISKLQIVFFLSVSRTFHLFQIEHTSFPYVWAIVSSAIPWIEIHAWEMRMTPNDYVESFSRAKANSFESKWCVNLLSLCPWHDHDKIAWAPKQSSFKYSIGCCV